MKIVLLKDKWICHICKNKQIPERLLSGRDSLRIPTKPKGIITPPDKRKEQQMKKKGAAAGSWSLLRHRLDVCSGTDPQLSFSQMTNASIGSDLFFPPPLLTVSLHISMSPDKRKGATVTQAASRQPGSEARHQDAAETPESPSQGWVIQERLVLSRSSCIQPVMRPNDS